MPNFSTIELKDLQITTDIGTYGPDDVVPDTHILDLRLTIDPKLVLIDDGGMDRVFDYDPLITEIDRLGRDGGERGVSEASAGSLCGSSGDRDGAL